METISKFFSFTINYFTIAKNFILIHHLTSIGWILLFSVIRPFVLIPISVLAIVIVITHKPLESVFIINLSALVSALTIYFFSKTFSGKINKRLAYNKILNKIKKYDFETFFLARLSMIVHFDMLSAVAGVTKAPLITFFLATFLGFIPESVIFGTLSLSLRNQIFLFTLVPLLLFYLILIILVRKRINTI